MNKSELVQRLAEVEGNTPAEAADTLDQVVHDILKNLKHGKLAAFPGLGTFLPDQSGRFQFRKTRPKGAK